MRQKAVSLDHLPVFHKMPTGDHHIAADVADLGNLTAYIFGILDNEEPSLIYIATVGVLDFDQEYEGRQLLVSSVQLNTTPLRSIDRYTPVEGYVPNSAVVRIAKPEELESY